MDITVIAESTPGPVAINTATFVGYKVNGVLGSFCATFGVVLPSFIIIFLISSFLAHFLEITWVANAFQGIKAAVAFLIFSAGWKMFRKMKKNKVELCVFAGSLLAMLLVNLKLVNFSAIYLILISAVIGLILYGIRKIRKGGKGE
jgi:chromate transporter